MGAANNMCTSQGATCILQSMSPSSAGLSRFGVCSTAAMCGATWGLQAAGGRPPQTPLPTRGTYYCSQRDLVQPQKHKPLPGCQIMGLPTVSCYSLRASIPFGV
mmetsp:Transcript_89991/g.155815  ORF Transcript_89991/g.155815 Transcript_89991/m.155815 type:complete len:104 (+) Transcript_89991:100-411(+)